MFIDIAHISIKAGDGGDGAVSFRREKYVAAGGPDGGDGGRGGDIILRTDTNKNTLMDFRYNRKYHAQHGDNGSSRNRSGRDGAPMVIRLPEGTLIKDRATGAVIADMSGAGDFVIARGGRGGWGNQHFATASRQAPRFAKTGREGQSREITLELKLLADVGLIGFPNVGKSTLLSVVSAARPKIANYHFTTLVPNLGIASVGDRHFTVADIPGIIEGASDGAGLGLDFLRHIERCRLLVHVVDISGSEGRDAVDDYIQINRELINFSSELAARPQLVAANKRDIAPDDGQLEALAAHCAAHNVDIFPISAAAHDGVDRLMQAVSRQLNDLPPIKIYQPEIVEQETDGRGGEIDITRDDGGAFIVTGEALRRMIDTVDLDDYESLNYLQRALKKAGVFEALEARGVKEGDTIILYGLEFDYVL